MFSLTKPSREVALGYVDSQRHLPFSYPAVGATRSTPPAGFNIDRNRIRLGDGETTFARAVDALRHWRQFDLGWVEIIPDDASIEVDTVVATQARALSTWSLNACRIVYTMN